GRERLAPEGLRLTAREPARTIGPAPSGPRVRAPGPRARADGAVLLAQQRLELAAVLAARVAGRPIDPTAVPDQPAARLDVDVLAVAQVEQLAHELRVRLGVRGAPADVTPVHDRDGHATYGTPA